MNNISSKGILMVLFLFGLFCLTGCYEMNCLRWEKRQQQRQVCERWSGGVCAQYKTEWYWTDVCVERPKKTQPYDDRSSTSPPVTSLPDEKVYLEFKSVKFFESGATVPPASERQFKTDFPRSATRYIYFHVLAKNLFYRSRSQKPLVRGQYFYPDGSFMAEAKVNVEISPEWQNTNLWAGWGWNNPGNWSLGTYRIEILFGNTKVGEGRFTIYNDRE